VVEESEVSTKIVGGQMSKGTATLLDKAAEEIVDNFINENITDALEYFEVWNHPFKAAYLALRIDELLPESSRQSFKNALSRRILSL